MIETLQRSHPKDELAAYVNGTLAPERASAVAMHLQLCDDCRQETVDWQAIAGAAQTFAGTAGSAPRGLLDRIQLRTEREDIAAPPSRSRRLRLWLLQPFARQTRRGRLRLAGGLAAAACIMFVALAGARADGLFDILKPQQLAAVPVSLQDLQSLPDLSNYGTLTGGPPSLTSITTFDSPDAAAAAAGISLRTPVSLPADVPTSVTYAVQPGSSASFTFSADKARETAAALGKSIPPMPANLDGATLQVGTGATVISLYRSQPVAPAGGQNSLAGVLSGIPALVIGQTPAPTVTATGSSAADIERYVLSLPGVSPQLAGAIRALGNPGNAWPVPIPVDLASSHSISVQGVTGLAIGDSTGLGGGLLWQKDGTIYAVGGTLSERELLSIANSLH